MTWTIRPAVRENTPLIIGIAGPTKSGKTYSAHRVAIGLKAGLKAEGPIVMLNAEGARGHQYAERFKYHACDIAAPFRPERYTEAVKEIAKLTPAVIIIDSASHMHDGPGGLLEYHDEELERLSRGVTNDRDRAKFNFTAWIKPKAAENEFIYTMLSLSCPVILAFRAKEKLKIVPGKQPIDLGWQPIAGERIAFETLFTVTLPPHCKGVPDLEISELREPFDTLIPKDKAIDEQLGQRLAEWSKGAARAPKAATPAPAASQPAPAPQPEQPPLAPAARVQAEQEAGEAFLEEPSPIDGGRRDEATTKGLVAAIEAEVGKWPRKPPADMLKAIYAGFLGGKTDPSQGDQAELEVMLADFRAYTQKDATAMAKINGFARAARVAS